MSEGIRTLQRGLEVLLAFANSGHSGALSLEELRDRLPFKLNRTTLYRHLITLESLGFVERVPDEQRYRVGPAVLDLAAAFLAGKELVLEANAPMEELAHETGETVFLGMLDQADVISLHRRGPPFPHTQLARGVGSRRPAYCSALGKAILSTRPSRACLSMGSPPG